MQGLKIAILAILQNGLGWLCFVSAALQESLKEIQKFFLFWVPITPYKDWKVKLERAHFSKVQSGKITVWLGNALDAVFQGQIYF